MKFQENQGPTYTKEISAMAATLPNDRQPESELFYDGLIRGYVDSQRFIPRPWLAARVEEALKLTHCRFVLLTAEPGAGKSAFMAWFAARHPHWPRYFIRRDQTAPLEDPGQRSFLRRIGYQLAAIHPALFRRDAIVVQVEQRIGAVAAGGEAVGVEIDRILTSPFYQTAIQIKQDVERVGGRVAGLRVREIVADPGRLPIETLQNMALFDPLKTLASDSAEAPAVVLVDALDELKFRTPGETLLNWLETCPELPPNLRFVLTSRPDPDLLSRFRGAQALGIVEIKDFQEDPHVSVDLERFARQLAKEPAVHAVLGGPEAADGFVNAARAKANGNLGYLDAIARAVDAAVASGDKGLLARVLALKALPGTLKDLYGFFLGLIKNDIQNRSVTVTDPRTRRRLYLEAWPAVYRPILGALAVARDPLTAPQVRRLAGIDADQAEVDSALTRCTQFLDRTGDGLRLYHATLPEFLNSNETRDNPDTAELWSNPLDAHAQVAAAYLDPAVGFLRSAEVDAYGLRHLAAHLWELRGLAPFRAALHNLAGDRAFLKRRLDHLGMPGPVLEDIDRALAVALEDDDLGWSWRHILAYRMTAHEERDFGRVIAAAREGDYRRALERTALYTDLPNSQAMARLWVAWEAATAGRWEEALTAARRALEQLPTHGVMAAQLRQAEPHAEAGMRDAIGNTLQMLPARIARLAADPEGWLADVTRNWSQDGAERARGFLQMPPEAWGSSFRNQAGGVAFPELLKRIAGHLSSADRPENFRAASFIYHRQLASGLYEARGETEWLGYVRQAVERVALDDYPSYREAAMGWLAQSVLAQEKDDESGTTSRAALAAVLEGVFRPAAPGFWGDAVAAALDRVDRENGRPAEKDRLIHYLKAVEASSERGLDPTRHLKPDDVLAWRQEVGLPSDPWAFGMRQRSAVAAVLHRRGDAAGAEALLQEAEREGVWGSYAGFRALARLSLACRRLEWHQADKALAQTRAAAQDAIHMLDPVLRQERAALVARVQAWMAAHPSGPSEEEGLALHQGEAGMGRGIALDFLSAHWHDDPARLKRLMRLALNDATAAGAVLGRLLGSLVLGPRPSRTFRDLLAAMDPEATMP
jgi:hypothetical protein